MLSHLPVPWSSGVSCGWRVGWGENAEALSNKAGLCAPSLLACDACLWLPGIGGVGFDDPVLTLSSGFLSETPTWS